MSTTFTDWRDKVALSDQLTTSFFGGRRETHHSDESFTVVTPISGENVADVSAAGIADVDRAVSAARTAFENGSWTGLSPRQRKQMLFTFAEVIRSHADELGALITLEMGKPLGVSTWEAGAAAAHLEWFGELVDHDYGDVAPLGPGAFGTITRVPMGVVAAIVPWNFPLLMAAWKLGPALATGNTVVLKPAEQSPLSALRLAELGAEAGLPPGVFNVVAGTGEVAGRALAEHPDVNAVTFTGSTKVGRLIMGYAASSNLKRVSLELGGKSPNIVLADAADLGVVAAQAAAGIFANTGQQCDAGSRLIVHESIADELIERVVAESAGWQPGNPFEAGVNQGPVVDAQQLDTILAYIATAQDDGDQLVSGGRRALQESGGFYVEPTVFRSPSNGTRLAREEVFGPVLSVITFSDEAEAVRIANDTEYGLAAAVWTSDVTKAHTISAQLRAGQVWVNAYDAGDISLPHGGFKSSGFGRDKSKYAIDNYTELKSTYFSLA
ncbi:aldehyde dehydrogenase family protein [Aeromicrobium sp. P5_D10]